jgi:hypothetical protein
MYFAKRFATVASALLLTLLTVAPAMAQLLPESSTYFETVRINRVSGAVTYAVNPNNVTLAGDVYNNTNPAAPANFGFSSTDLGSVWGDQLATTGTGILQENDFTIFNSGSSAGPLLSAVCVISFYDGGSFAPLGSYTGSINFGAGLPPGSFAIASFTGLGALNINLNTQNVIVTQVVVSKTGTATRLGIASLDPPSIGSSTNTMYISSSTVGPAGFYNIGNPALNANPGYRVNVSNATPVGNATWGGVKALYH